MEGYSVTEAASILGVPTERVWELLARGLLAGTPEGEGGMRVFLQPRQAPAPPSMEAANGNHGKREPEGELSPFRELLTEFRNLTERYGQALLALGESRGEVAELRARVDLLETRMDLRQPVRSAAPSPWPAPESATIVPPVAAEHATEAPRTDAPQSGEKPHSKEMVHAEEHPEGEEHRRRRRGHRRATESFAEALARAEDPTRPELPGAAETAAAMAALREEAAHDEAALPRELPAAEPMPTPEEEQESASVEPAVTVDVSSDTAEPVSEAATETAEPAPEASEAAPGVEEVALEPQAAIAEPTEVGQLETVEPESVEAPQSPESVAKEAEVAEFSTTTQVAAESEATEAESAESEQVGSPPRLEVTEEASRAAAATEPIASPAAEEEPEPEPEPIAFDPERYTVEIIEPDWYADEESSGVAGSTVQPEASDEPARSTLVAEPDASKGAAQPELAEPEAAEPETTEPEAAQPEIAEPEVADHAAEAPPSEIAAEVAREHASEAPTPPSAEQPALEAPTASADAAGEETMLWFGRAPQQSQPAEPSAPSEDVDEGADEMEVVGAAAPRPQPAGVPGSRDLDDALAALNAVARPGPASGVADEGRPPAVDADLSAMQAGTGVPLPVPDAAAGTGRPTGLLASVRPQTTSASRAYRRLRRIFPG